MRFHNVVSPVGKKKKRDNLMSSTKKILVFRMGSIGDTVVALPAFHLIRQTYPNHQIYLLTNEPISGKAAPAMTLLEGAGLCDGSLAYPSNSRDYSQLSALRQEIRSHNFETAVHLFTDLGRGWLRSWRDCLFLRSCGIRHVLGWPPLWPPKPAWQSPGVMERQSVGLVCKLHRLGQSDINNLSAWELHLRANEKEMAALLLQEGDISQPFMVASIGTKALAKDWGDDNWMRVLAQIYSSRPDIGLVLIGAADEQERSENIRRQWSGKSLNLCGRCEPRISAAVLAQASLFVGHDSGPMHLAAAMGIPVVAIFSWHNAPGYWFPGSADWPQIQIFYPPLPEGHWHPGLRMLRSPTEGVLLIQPEPVAEACLRLLLT